MTLTTLFITMSAQFGLPHGLLESVCFIESSHNTQAIHRNDGIGNSIGVCQIKLKTARFMGYRGTEKGLLAPKVNTYYAAKYLQYQIVRYRGDTARALVAYNRGNAYQLTKSSYSERVLKHWGTNGRSEISRRTITSADGRNASSTRRYPASSAKPKTVNITSR